MALSITFRASASASARTRPAPAKSKDATRVAHRLPRIGYLPRRETGFRNSFTGYIRHDPAVICISRHRRREIRARTSASGARFFGRRPFFLTVGLALSTILPSRPRPEEEHSEWPFRLPSHLPTVL